MFLGLGEMISHQPIVAMMRFTGCGVGLFVSLGLFDSSRVDRESGVDANLWFALGELRLRERVRMRSCRSRSASFGTRVCSQSSKSAISLLF